MVNYTLCTYLSGFHLFEVHLNQIKYRRIRIPGDLAYISGVWKLKKCQWKSVREIKLSETRAGDESPFISCDALCLPIILQEIVKNRLQTILNEWICFQSFVRIGCNE
jgi:hypothetical protein